jgi:hypothetical protein
MTETLHAANILENSLGKNSSSRATDSGTTVSPLLSCIFSQILKILDHFNMLYHLRLRVHKQLYKLIRGKPPLTWQLFLDYQQLAPNLEKWWVAFKSSCHQNFAFMVRK